MAVCRFQRASQQGRGRSEMDHVPLESALDLWEIGKFAVRTPAEYKIPLPVFRNGYKGKRCESFALLEQMYVYLVALQDLPEKGAERILSHAAYKNAVPSEFGNGAGHVRRSSSCFLGEFTGFGQIAALVFGNKIDQQFPDAIHFFHRPWWLR